MRLGWIYLIINKVNGRFYIGSTINPDTRWIGCHLVELRSNTHANPFLQREFNKYGEESFIYLPFLSCPLRVRLLIEWVLIQNLNPDFNIVRHLRGLGEMDDKKRLLRNEKVSKSCKDVWNRRSAEERETIRKNQSRSQSKRWANMSQEERDRLSRMSSEKMKRIWAERGMLKKSPPS